MPISDKLIDQLLEGSSSCEAILGEDGLLKELTKKVAERVMEGEMAFHLGYAKHAPSGNNTGNSRNGKSHKSVRSVHGDISQVTNAVMDEVKAWQSRTLDALYPIVYLDALVIRSRASGAVQNQSVGNRP